MTVLKWKLKSMEILLRLVVRFSMQIRFYCVYLISPFTLALNGINFCQATLKGPAFKGLMLKGPEN